jgi:hypothetical protein
MTPCKVCARPDRAAIDERIVAGTSFREIGRAFGVPKDTIARHARAHVAAATSGNAKRSRENARKRVSRSLSALKVAVTIETPADVMRELSRLYSEALTLFEQAKATGDTRLQEKALAQGGVLIEKLAKALGVFTDAAIVVDRSTKVLNVLADVPEDVLRAFLTGEIKELPGVA